MLREYEKGNRVTSVAIQSLGIGTIEHPSFTHATVVWDDGTWSKERYQDLIFVGHSRNEPLPIPTENGANPLPLVGSNEGLNDHSRKFDETPDFEKDNLKYNPDMPGGSSYQYGSANLNPDVFSAPLVAYETWNPEDGNSHSNFGSTLQNSKISGRDLPVAKIRQEELDKELQRVITKRLLSGRITEGSL